MFLCQQIDHHPVCDSLRHQKQILSSSQTQEYNAGNQDASLLFYSRKFLG